MLFSLLDTTAESSSSSGNIVSYILIGVLVVILIGAMIVMNRRRAKQEKEAKEQIDAVKPGNKITTIGGIVGIVVAVDPTDDSLILETGDEDHGKSYIKFIRQAIYLSDAVVPKADKKGKDDKAEPETSGEEKVEDAAAEAATNAEPEANPSEEKSSVDSQSK